jgi:hypothetical protein
MIGFIELFDTARVCLGVKPLETHDQRFFPQLNPCGIRLYVTSSLRRRWVCLLRMCLTFRQVCVSYSMLLNIRPFAKSSVSTGFAKQIMPILPHQAPNCPAYNISARTAQKTPFHFAVETCLFAKPLLCNGCCIAACFAFVA